MKGKNPTSRVDWQEAEGIKVGRWLLQKGFRPANCLGDELKSLGSTEMLGILCNDSNPNPAKCVFGLFNRDPVRTFLGIVRFRESPHPWIFDVHGRNYLELARSLAEEMAETFNVNISLQLFCEEPKFEMPPRIPG